MRHKTLLILVVILPALMLPVFLFASGIEYSPELLRYIGDRWGDKGQKNVLNWNQFILAQQSLPRLHSSKLQIEHDELIADNLFWNRIPYFTDKAHWGIDDYWATPIETLGSNGGDCEDYSIGKYFTLKSLGIPIQKLRIVYVRARTRNEPHMVLAYYPEPDADPFILDNLTNQILPASKRTDLDPIFSFNDDDLWSEGQNIASSLNDEGRWSEDTQFISGKSSQIRLWRDLLAKMALEQTF